MLNAFRPNQNLTSRSWAILLSTQMLALFAFWWLSSSSSIPGPLDVLTTLGRLIAEEGLLYELGVSLKVNLKAIALSTVLSVGLAYLSVLPVVRPLVALCSKARFLSLSGFVTAFILGFGGGEGLKVALLTFGMTVFFLTSMAAVVAEIPKADWDQARTLQMSDWRSVWEVVVLGKADQTFEVLRQNAAIGWMMLTMVEGLVRSQGGVGAMLLNTAKYRHFDVVFAVQLTLFLVGLAQDQLLAYLKFVCCPYAHLTLERK